MKIVVASNSPVKLNALKQYTILERCERSVIFSELCEHYEICGYEVDIAMAEQPIGGAGLLGARMRLKKLQDTWVEKPSRDTILVAIENSIDVSENGCQERCNICAFIPEIDIYIESEYAVNIDDEKIASCIEAAKTATPEDYEYRQYGWSTTVGKMVVEKYQAEYPELEHNDWIKPFCSEKISRVRQIRKAFERIYLGIQTANTLRATPDWPIAGIKFIDISKLLCNDSILEQIMHKAMMKYLYEVDVIVGLDARGFIFGAYLAAIMPRPFVMIRKSGKLPPNFSSNTVDGAYEKEYGSDSFSIPTDVIKKGDRCLLVDDVLATGGSLSAAASLVEQQGGVVAGIWVLIVIKRCQSMAAAKLSKYNIDNFLFA